MHLSDQVTDLIGEGFDLAVRITTLSDSSLVARRLRDVSYFIAAAPGYWDRRGRPSHPRQLADHACLGYAYSRTPGAWRLQNSASEEVAVRFDGPLRANNAEALVPAALAGVGVVLLPDFMLSDLIADGSLEAVLPDWSLSPTGLNLVMPPGGPRPARVEVLVDFLAERLGRTPRRMPRAKRS